MSYFRRIDQVLGYAEWSLSRAASRLRGLMAHPKLFFMHIPKTGGTSVKSAIYNKRKAWYDCHVDAGKTRRAIRENIKNANREKYFRELFKLRQSMAVRRLKANKPVVTGHIPVPSHFLSKFGEYNFFTIVRNPVDRWISDYRFSYEIDGLSTFFDGDNPDHPVDGIERALKSECGAPQRNIYTNYFSGYGLVNKLSVQERRKKAIKNVKKWKNIFEIEKMSRVEKFLSQNFGYSIEIGKSKKTDIVDGVGLELEKVLGQKKVREEIETALQSDMKVYRAAIARAN